MKKTFGRLSFRDGRFVVDCEPHVLLRLKRVFGRVGKGQFEKVGLQATAEVARELEWFMERFRLLMDVRTRTELERLAKQHRDQETLVSRLLAGRLPAEDFELAVPARDYQKLAAQMVLGTGGLLIADDLGIGKTCAAICVLTRRQARPALVVTLTALPEQWRREINRFAPELSVHVLKSGQPYDLTKGGVTPDVIISNYHKLAGWAETLAGVVQTVVFDEAQELRRGSASHKGQAAFHISGRARYRVGLTATPIYNYGGEIWHVMQALRPGELGSYDEFVREWGTELSGRRGERRSTIDDPRAFGSYMRDSGLMLRRTRAEVGRELPACTRVPHHVDADLEVLKKIEQPAAELARIILSTNPEARGAKFRAAEDLSALVRQATGIAKAPYVAGFVRMLVESGERVLLYGWHREVYSIWLEALEDFKPAMFTGSESPKQKEEAFKRFTTKETPLLIMSLRAGAGLDGLQHSCRTVVKGELDFSPGVHEQATGRVYRDGQPDPVVVYYLLSQDGSDPVIADVLGLKKAQIDGLREPYGKLVGEAQADPDHVRKLALRYIEKRYLSAHSGEPAIND